MPEEAAGAGEATEAAADPAGCGSVLTSVTVMACSLKLVYQWMARSLCSERQTVGFSRCHGVASHYKLSLRK
jgi:hypothetical protein